jgi:hypothetical protein
LRFCQSEDRTDFSNVSEFTPAILGHHDAIKLERFRGPDGLLQTPAQLKEVFESVYRLTAKPQEGNSLHFVANTQPPDAYLALRTQPNSRQGSRIKIMPNGTLLQVLQRRNDGWWQVRVVPSGEQGWTLSGQGSRQWIRCCSAFDPQNDSVAITLEELVRKFERHPNVLSEIEKERREFRPRHAAPSNTGSSNHQPHRRSPSTANLMLLAGKLTKAASR